MTIDEAIEILNLYEHAASSIPRDDFLGALKLGIEALKAIKAHRLISLDHLLELLPGETKD